MKESELLEKYSELKTAVEEAQSEYDMSQGALITHMDTLKKQFGCNTIAEAKKQLKQLQRDAGDTELKFQKALSAFEKEWEGMSNA